MESNQINNFCKELFNCNFPVFLTGAGISTESGIPDFRGKNGYWKTNKPILFEDFIASEKVRLQSWQRFFSNKSVFANAKPNITHTSIAQIQKNMPNTICVTQNVDNLHFVAGCAEDRTIEVHGNSSYAKCLDCHTRYELDQVKQMLDQTPNSAPRCDQCNGIIKVATISFGQPMPEAETRRAFSALQHCDLFISAGTSLSVYPIADLVQQAANNNIPIAIFNAEATAADHLATYHSNLPLGQIFQQIHDYQVSYLNTS